MNILRIKLSLITSIIRYDDIIMSMIEIVFTEMVYLVSFDISL